jgi:hypothetical protein
MRKNYEKMLILLTNLLTKKNLLYAYALISVLLLLILFLQVLGLHDLNLDMQNLINENADLLAENEKLKEISEKIDATQIKPKTTESETESRHFTNTILAGVGIVVFVFVVIPAICVYVNT